METLQDWGVLCNVPPSEITLEALLKVKPDDQDVAT
jgi:hypothetical protein